MFGKTKQRTSQRKTAKRTTRRSSRNSVKQKKAKPYVRSSTIRNSVGGGFSNPNEAKVCKVGKHKVLVTRAGKLDRYGNPIHTATLINKDGSLGKSYKSNGSASLVVSKALKLNGIETKYSKR